MLQLRNIRKTYTTGDFTQVALNGVSLDLRDNEFVAILGRVVRERRRCSISLVGWTATRTAI